MLSKSHPLSRYILVKTRQIAVKIMKKIFWCILTLKLGSLVIDKGYNLKIQARQIFFGTLYLFDSIFSIIVWPNRLHDFDEGICFLDNCCHENRLKTFLQWSEQRLLRGKDASVGNSMLNHPGHVTLTLWIF